MSEHVPSPDATPGPQPAGAPSAMPEPGATPPSTNERISSIFDSIRRSGLVRSNDRWIGGVASGIALRLGVDALLVRAAFILLSLFTGAGFVLYALAWALLPEQSDGRIHLQEVIRGHFDSAIAGAGVMLVIGMTWTVGRFGWWGGWGHRGSDGIFGVALVAFIIYLVITFRNGRRQTPPPYAPGAPVPPGAHPTPTTGPVPPTTSQTTPYGPMPRPAAPTSQAPLAAPVPFGTQAPVGPQPAAHHGTPWQATAHQGAPGTRPIPDSYGATTQTSPVPPQAPSFVKQPPLRPSDQVPPYQTYVNGQPQQQARWQPPTQFAPVVTAPPKKGPGAAAFGVVVGLSLLVFALLIAAERVDRFDGNVAVTAFGAAAVLAGLCIIVAGIRGRSSGAVGFIALVALLFGAPLASVNLSEVTWGGTSYFIGDSTFTPTSWDAASEGYTLGVGQTTIDLSGLDVPTTKTFTVPAQMGAGSLTVILPSDVSASAAVSLGAGDVNWRVDGADEDDRGVGRSTADFATDDVLAGARADVHLEISAGAGDILIKEES